MARWQVVKSSAIAPYSDAGVDAAYRVAVAGGTAAREVVVEFAAPSAVASGSYAEEVARRFLQDAEPPQHLLVAVGGEVTVVRGPLDVIPDDGPSAQPSPPQPQRARQRRRG